MALSHRRGDTLKFGMVDSASRAEFHVYGAEMWEYSPQNYQKVEFCTQICPSGVTGLHNFYEILSGCMCV